MIKEIIFEYWKNPLPELMPREFNFNLLELDFINDIVGIRRAGKTYLMFYILHYLIEKEKRDKKSTIYLNFENRRLYPLKQDYFKQLMEFIFSERLLEKFSRLYLFFDEIQNLDGWEQYIRSIYDEFKGKIKIVISGSNEKLLQKEYSSLLTGRHITVRIFPLSLSEFLTFKGMSIGERDIILERERSIIKRELENYLEFGGFPEVVLGEEKKVILQQYFTDIVTKDVLFKEKIGKDITLIEELGAYLINNVAQRTSFRRLSNFFQSRGSKISVPTIQNYYKLFEEAFLFFHIRIFSYKIKDQIQHPLKIYTTDSGLINALSFRFSPDWGKLYENTVAVELRRRGREIYYWKDTQHREVDFVIKEGLEVFQLVQVCFELDNEEIKKREIASLLKASEELNCINLLVITKDLEGEEEIKSKKIIYIPLWKWLLQSRQKIEK